MNGNEKINLLSILAALFILIGFFSTISWAFPIVHRWTNETAKIDYKEEQRNSMLGDAYTMGIRFGEEAAGEFDEESHGENIETAVVAWYEKKEPSSIMVGPNDFLDFPDKEYFNKMVKRSPSGKGDLDDLVAAFKSGYTDGFIQYYK